MRLSGHQLDRLAAMGLTLWVPRKVTEESSVALQSSDAPADVPVIEPAPCLVLVIEPTAGRRLSEDLSDLLGKILAAMSLQQDQCQVEVLDQATGLDRRDDLSQREQIVIFSDAAVAEMNPPRIVLPALSRIRVDRASKAEAWSRIKHWLSLRRR